MNENAPDTHTHTYFFLTKKAKNMNHGSPLFPTTHTYIYIGVNVLNKQKNKKRAIYSYEGVRELHI